MAGQIKNIVRASRFANKEYHVEYHRRIRTMSSMKLRDVANTSKIQCAPSVAILMKRRTSGRVPVILNPFYSESWSGLSTVKSGHDGGETVQFVALLMERRRQRA